MKAIVKAMWVDSATIDLERYAPDDPEVFGIWIEFRAGPLGNNKADDFRLFACSPEWLKRACREKRAYWGRHMLILDNFDLEVIKGEISQKVEGAVGENWIDVAAVIARFAAWEFEDYRA
jgi:hypothetical protein